MHAKPGELVTPRCSEGAYSEPVRRLPFQGSRRICFRDQMGLFAGDWGFGGCGSAAKAPRIREDPVHLILR